MCDVDWEGDLIFTLFLNYKVTDSVVSCLPLTPLKSTSKCAVHILFILPKSSLGEHIFYALFKGVIASKMGPSCRRLLSNADFGRRDETFNESFRCAFKWVVAQSSAENIRRTSRYISLCFVNPSLLQRNSRRSSRCISSHAYCVLWAHPCNVVTKKNRWSSMLLAFLLCLCKTAGLKSCAFWIRPSIS